MHRNEVVHAIPLWINGRANLKVAQDYHEIRSPANGRALRRIPLCGEEVVSEAVDAATEALPGWLSEGESGRRRMLAKVGDALSDLAGHFSQLIVEDSGKDHALAQAEVEQAVFLLREARSSPVLGAAVVVGAAKGFPEALALAAAALAGGATLVVCPAPESSSVFCALAELAGRCGVPAGVVNVVYPRPGALDGLHSAVDVTVLGGAA